MMARQTGIFYLTCTLIIVTSGLFFGFEWVAYTVFLFCDTLAIDSIALLSQGTVKWNTHPFLNSSWKLDWIYWSRRDSN
jgi:hypothetical protein